MVPAILFPGVLVGAGIALLYFKTVSVTNTREIARPGSLYAGVVCVAMGFGIVTLYVFMESKSAFMNGINLFWIVPGSYLLAVIILLAFSTKRVGEFIPESLVQTGSGQPGNRFVDLAIRVMIALFLVAFSFFGVGFGLIGGGEMSLIWILFLCIVGIVPTALAVLVLRGEKKK